MFNHSIYDLVRQRYSCRSYDNTCLDHELIGELERFMENNTDGPFSSMARFMTVSASLDNMEELKGLGTYGKIKNPSAFIIGAVENSNLALEDYGYLMEKGVLFSTDIGLSSCWLGGSFNKSQFSKRIGIENNEIIPAVACVGYAHKDRERRRKRTEGRTCNRKSWEQLFYHYASHTPLSKKEAGRYSEILEMVRLAPSAMNLQPWRIAKEDNRYHFFLEPSRSHQLFWGLIGKENLQRVDMGIAMCHFELAAIEAGIAGRWAIEKLDAIGYSRDYTYVASWVE